jgi:hypothetical protein
MRKGALLIGVLLALPATAVTPLATAGASSALTAGASSARTPTAVASIAGASSAKASSALTAASAVFLEDQPAVLAIKPHSYYSHLSVHNLTWSNWGAPTASAQGTFTFQFCVEESCSVSPFYDESAALTLTAIERCGTRSAYTALQLEVSGTLPDSSFKSYRTTLGCPAPRVLRRHAVRRRKHG